MTKIEATFEFEKDTKRTYRFTEVGSAHINTIYVQKASLNNEQPKKIKVTVEVIE